MTTKVCFRTLNVMAIRCDVTGREFYEGAVRSCPHPAMIKKYGTGGVCRVSWYVCSKCKFKRTYPYTGGLGCDYKMDVHAGEKG